VVNEAEAPILYKLDHHYSTSSLKPKTAVLYAEIGTKEFLAFHKVLKPLAEKHSIDYVLRHYIVPVSEKLTGYKIIFLISFFLKSKQRDAGKILLSGYGVELQIKSTEYKVQDDSKVIKFCGRDLTIIILY